ncbi:2504_t:CDS:2 [Funneliformis geosporum]|uniref:13447_t:CDS:1 n=1 Tax=Funneliformis geosporum TaxID=1117311 RepID=A0A9W4WRI4_9GLOM|nr:2504_t:CDS:2 [Funneliformis geosporum]CAI2166703.1 13447_t:CDS:2 [Funneliformis geosporum]
MIKGKLNTAVDKTVDFVEKTDPALDSLELITHIAEAASVVIPYVQFVPLVNEVSDILNKVIDLYKTAQHNKNITKVLVERIIAASSAVEMLKAREDLFTLKNYTSLQRLVEVLQKMKKYIEGITQYNTVQKFLGAKLIEKQFKELCKDYDSSITLLSFTLTVDFKINSEKEDLILKEDIEELLKFQAALAESIGEVDKKISHVDEKISGASDKVNLVIEKVSEMQITMQSLINNPKSEKQNQNRIDTIFNEPLLPFEDYEEADEPPRTVRLRKYVHVKTKEDFAFKRVDKENYNTVKNQVTILKKLKDCQNIIHFYGLTKDDKDDFHSVTEWAENKNLRDYIISYGQIIEMRLRIRFAYDIAKGLNFLNSVKIVHRDIRSENIVITYNDVAKITNFKFSRDHNAATSNLSANKETIVYTAPELLKRITEVAEQNENKKRIADDEAKKKYDTKCEVYSFGILLWEIAECRVPYDGISDFLEITKLVISGHREPFTPGIDIPEKYKSLVNKAVDQNPGLRPIFAKMLTDLQDIFSNYTKPTVGTLNNGSGRFPPNTPVRKMTSSTIAAAEEDCVIDFYSINLMSLDKAIEEHKKDSMDKRTLYKCFDNYAKIGNPGAKYWKAYYILKDYSDLDCSKSEKYKIAAELYKEAADYGDEYPDAQLRYATLVMQGKGVEPNTEEAVNYFVKAAKNDHVVAMFNVSTYYFSQGNVELGRYYMMMAASKKYEQAIKYCKDNKITY